MTTRQELEWLVNMLKKRAEENRENASRVTEGFIKGLYDGYASAYETSAHWIEEILTNA